MKKVLSLWLITATIVLAGCQRLGSLEAPEVSVSGIALNSISLFEQEWGLTLRARNPNDRELTLKSLDYEIFINGEKFARCSIAWSAKPESPGYPCPCPSTRKAK